MLTFPFNKLFFYMASYNKPLFNICSLQVKSYPILAQLICNLNTQQVGQKPLARQQKGCFNVSTCHITDSPITSSVYRTLVCLINKLHIDTCLLNIQTGLTTTRSLNPYCRRQRHCDTFDISWRRYFVGDLQSSIFVNRYP